MIFFQSHNVSFNSVICQSCWEGRNKQAGRDRRRISGYDRGEINKKIKGGLSIERTHDTGRTDVYPPYWLSSKEGTHQALQTSQIAPNLVNREFREHGPRKILLTDVTYLFYKKGVCYLSPIIDAFTHELLAYELSENLKVDFVLAMIDNMCSTYSAELDDETIVHSDQGFHYTSKAFIQKLKDFDFKQSMSRKGNCWDNAPQESFFGHMKDEISQRIAQSETFEEVKAIVDCWINYYNENRYQWDLEMLSPKEYYTYVTTGVYPLQKGISKQKRGSAPTPRFNA